MAPPEMMNGSSSGSVSSYSSAVAMRMVRQIEEMERAVAALEPPVLFQLEQDGDEPVSRIEHEGVQDARRPRSFCGSILGQRQLEERMQLDRRAAPLRIG